MKIKKYDIFNLVINEENKECKIVLGNNLIDTCVNEENAKQKINKKSWTYILRVIIVIVKKVIEEEKK